MKHAMTLAVLTVSAASICAIASESEPYPVELLMTGVLHGDEVQSEGGADWWGLYPTDNGTELRSITVTIQPEHDPIVDVEGEATGKLVSTDTSDDAVILLRGLDFATAGPVVTTYAHEQDRLGSPESRALARRSVEFGGREESSEFGPVIRDYRIVVRDLDTGAQQVLLESDALSTDYNSPHVVWAGDLDRDGRLDVLMDMTTHYNVMKPTLFLSTLAKPGELVGLAGQLTLTGC